MKNNTILPFVDQGSMLNNSIRIEYAVLKIQTLKELKEGDRNEDTL